MRKAVNVRRKVELFIYPDHILTPTGESAMNSALKTDYCYMMAGLSSPPYLGNGRWTGSQCCITHQMSNTSRRMFGGHTCQKTLESCEMLFHIYSIDMTEDRTFMAASFFYCLLTHRCLFGIVHMVFGQSLQHQLAKKLFFIYFDPKNQIL